jgi:hypothetical protein
VHFSSLGLGNFAGIEPQMFWSLGEQTPSDTLKVNTIALFMTVLLA